MASIPNPPIFDADDPPLDGQVLIYDAATNQWVPAAITAATVDVPQDAIAAAGDADAQTAAEVAVADAVSPANVAYTQADQSGLADLVNALKVQGNATVVDVAALIVTVDALVEAFNTLAEELATAGILTP